MNEQRQPYKYRPHKEGEPHKWSAMLHPRDHRLCYICGRMESASGRVMREGAKR